MPRIDNSDPAVIAEYELEDVPGLPVDLCRECHLWEWTGKPGIDHPNYEDGLYMCIECGARLTSLDN